jgi:hypothetical protein
MRPGLLLLGITILLAGCITKTPPPPTPGTRVIYLGEQRVTTWCERGTQIYLSDEGALAIVPSGCAPDGKP